MKTIQPGSAPGLHRLANYEQEPCRCTGPVLTPGPQLTPLQLEELRAARVLAYAEQAPGSGKEIDYAAGMRRSLEITVTLPPGRRRKIPRHGCRPVQPEPTRGEGAT